MYDAVTSSDKPNFLGAQVPDQHALNIQAWKKYIVRGPDIGTDARIRFSGRLHG